MMATLCSASALDAGVIGGILWRYLNRTDWMPCLYSGAETVAYCGTMIDRNWVTVAKLDQHVIGFIARFDQEILSLYVDDMHQGLGVGTLLVDHAKAADCRLSLRVFQANKDARRFYARHGFMETDTSDGAGNDEGLPDVQLVWERMPS